MKKLLNFLLLLLTLSIYAQAPAYYSDVNLNQTGTALKDELSTKITNTQSTSLSYTPSVWNALQQSDLDPNDASKVLLIYGYNDNDGDFMTDRSRSTNDNGGGTGLWNREHVYPKSLGNPNLGTSGAGSDAHSLRPCDGQMNSSRSNRKFAAGSGNAGITAQGHFYPGDEWKGDVARMMMYMYLRYGSRCLPSNVAVGTTVAGDANMISILLQWNVEDPVNGFEDNRNEVIAGIQGNRNPFIDNPAFATQIWGGPQAEDRFGMGVVDTEAPTVPQNVIASNTTSNSTILSWNASTDNIGVTAYNVFQNGSFVASVSTTTYNVLGLNANSTYSFSVIASDAQANTSANSTVLTVNTQSAGSGNLASELFISEYIEGSSNNKALEVANFTGNTVDLSMYSLKKVTNGSGSFTSTFNLSGQLVNGEVYVVANSSATASILNGADVTSSIAAFNGNDAIGLFKNNQLIDILGDINSSANFAKDVTLRRKASIVDPNAIYTVSEWDSFPQDTFGNLGIHAISGSPTILTYCSSKGNNSSYEFIDFIALGGVSNATTANNGYAAFTTQTGNINYGSNTIIVSAGFSGQSYTEQWRAWIDFNQNGTFESDEEILKGSSSSSANLSYNFTVPNSALQGATRLRVSMKWDGTPEACETFSYGEVEDYKVNIGSGSAARFRASTDIKIENELGNEPSVFKSKSINTNRTLRLQMADDRMVTYTVYNMSGRFVARGQFTNTIDFNNLNAGMYIVNISDGQRQIQQKIIKR